MKINRINDKIILASLTTLAFFLTVTQTVFCQAEKLGIVSYSPPEGWTKTAKENVVAFSEINQTTGRFCIITLYGATPGSGSPTGDFKKEWNDLAAKPLNADPSPKTETQSADGWTITAGGASVDVENGKALAFLTVISGFGKTVSILAIFNDQTYLNQVDAFISGIDLDKTSAPAPNPIDVKNRRLGNFGSMTYTPPPGWSEQQFADGVVFKPLDLPAGEQLAIQIMQPLNASGTLEQALQRSYDEAAAMYNATKMNDVGGGNYSMTEARRSFNGWEYIRGKGGIQVENGTPYKTELGLELFIVRVNSRFERVAILESRTNCNLSRYYPSDRASYRDGIENLLFSLRFADLHETSLTSGSADGAGITGVWQGISLSVGPTSVSQPLGVGYKVFSPIFLSNGQAYFGPKFPSQGLAGMNTRIPPELYRRDWGTYTFNNGRGVLKMPYGDIPLRIEGKTLIITTNKTDHKFYRLPSVDGAAFSGTYALNGPEGKTVSITFAADGSFTDNGAVKVLYHEYIDCINPVPNSGSGTYQVKDYSIIFSYRDGRKVQIAFLGSEYDRSNPSPATLLMSFNEDRLTRR